MDLPAKTKAKRRHDAQLWHTVRRIKALVPHLDNRAYSPTLQSFARITVMIDRLHNTLLEQDSLLKPDGEVKGIVDSIRRCILAQTRLAESLGLTPATLRSLARDAQGTDLVAEFQKLNEDRDE